MISKASGLCEYGALVHVHSMSGVHVVCNLLLVTNEWQCWQVVRIGHLHDGIIWLQLPECILLQSLLCRFVSRTSDSSQKKNTEYNSLPQSILVVVVKWCHHVNALFGVVIFQVLRFHENWRGINGFSLHLIILLFIFLPQIWVDENRQLLYFMATKDTPLELHL